MCVCGEIKRIIKARRQIDTAAAANTLIPTSSKIIRSTLLV